MPAGYYRHGIGVGHYRGASAQPCIHSVYSSARYSARDLRSHTAWHSSSLGE
jgi:hypothetical protein